MQKVLAALAFLLVPSSMLFAQDATEKMNSGATPPPVVKPARDFLMVRFTYDNWIQKPDSVHTKTFNYGVSVNLCYDFPIKKTHLSFATGLGINTATTYLNEEVIR